MIDSPELAMGDNSCRKMVNDRCKASHAPSSVFSTISQRVKESETTECWRGNENGMEWWGLPDQLKEMKITDVVRMKGESTGCGG